MTAIKAEPSREAAIKIIDEWTGDVLKRGFASSWHYGELLDALRVPAGEPVAPNNGESLITVKIPEGYASTWDFLNDCGLEAVYPTAPAGDAGVREPRWVSPIKTVGDLVSSLLTLDQAMEVHGAYHITSTEDRCRARGLSLSLEHVINNRIKPDKTIPHSLVVWTAPAEGDRK